MFINKGKQGACEEELFSQTLEDVGRSKLDDVMGRHWPATV